jgi:Ser/Thr protein kinase RdoA (MazF antagonist)
MGIPGHQRLVDDIRIIHRDVSAQNVLLGKDNAPEGGRGVLIDFNLAFRATDLVPTIMADHNIVHSPYLHFLTLFTNFHSLRASPSFSLSQLSRAFS